MAAHTALFITAGQLLGELAVLDIDSTLFPHTARQFNHVHVMVVSTVTFAGHG